MTKRTKALSGASQDAYFRRVFKTQSSLSAEERDQLVRLLRSEIAQLRLRRKAPVAVDATADVAKAAPVEAPQQDRQPVVAPALQAAPEAPPAPPIPAAPPFDPFALNVVVLVRTEGRDGALSALEAVDDLDNLRLLAREQRLSVSADLGSTAELRAAIVQAAERRIANRIAAAS